MLNRGWSNGAASKYALGQGRCEEMHLGNFEMEADDPLDESGQRALIWQIRAKRRRARAQDDFAVVEFCAHRRASPAREGDLVHSHQDYPPSACCSGAVSVPGAWGLDLTLHRVIPS